MLQIIATDVTLIQFFFLNFSTFNQAVRMRGLLLISILLFVFSMTIGAFDKIPQKYMRKINAKIQEIMAPESSYMEEIKKRLGQLPG